MKIATLLLGHLEEELRIQGDLIGVDGGAYQAAKRGLRMKTAIGDFDSVDDGQFIEIKKYADEIIQLPCVKDETDSEAAILWAKENGYERLEVYGALGGRLDHEYVNLQLLIRNGEYLRLHGKKNLVYVLEKGKHFIEKQGYTYVSFFPLEETIVSMIGSKYELNHTKMTPKDIYGVSNEIVKESMVLETSGKMLVIQCSDA